MAMVLSIGPDCLRTFKVIFSSPDSIYSSDSTSKSLKSKLLSNSESVTSSTVGFLDMRVHFGGHFGKFTCQVLLMFFFQVIEMLVCMLAGPGDTDLQHRIMNLSDILVCYVMKHRHMHGQIFGLRLLKFC